MKRKLGHTVPEIILSFSRNVESRLKKWPLNWECVSPKLQNTNWKIKKDGPWIQVYFSKAEEPKLGKKPVAPEFKLYL